MRRPPPILLLHIIQLLCLATVTSRPLDENSLPESEESAPLFERDGHVKYSLGNSSVALEDSRFAFQQLRADDGEPAVIPLSRPRHKNKTQRHRNKNKGGRKGVAYQEYKGTMEEEDDIPKGWRQAIAVANPGALKNDKSYCQSQKFKQQIKEPGCLSKVVINRFCHGTCPSIFIPRMRAKKLKPLFQSSAVCQPSEYDVMQVTLDCPGQLNPTVTKTIVVVKACSCQNPE